MAGKLTFGSLLVAASLMQAPRFPPALARLARTTRPQIIRQESDLVALPVTVTDRRGQFVSGLKAGDFQVLENGKAQRITLFTQTDVPVAVGLIVDGSASMNPNRPEVVAAARDFLVSSNPQDQIFVVNFNEKASLGLPPSMPFTNNVKDLEAAVLRGPTAGMTALYDATAMGLRHLALSKRDKKALIIISDGGDDASTVTFRQILSTAQHSNAIIYTIGIIAEGQAQVNPEALRKLARETGGDAFFPKSPSDLPAICREIAQDLRDQYTIGYVPSNLSRDGTYRAIRVIVRAPGRGRLTARTRKGYFAGSGPAQAPYGALGKGARE